MRRVAIAVALAAVVAQGVAQGFSPAIGASGQPGPWKLLFDGKTTAGWRGYNQKALHDSYS